MGTYPTEYRDKIAEIVNFDHLQWVECINHNAFGYIDYETDVPKAVLGRYELWTDPNEDKLLEKVVKIMVRCILDEDFERFEACWDKLTVRYGYTDREIDLALSKNGL